MVSIYTCHNKKHHPNMDILKLSKGLLRTLQLRLIYNKNVTPASSFSSLSNTHPINNPFDYKIEYILGRGFIQKIVYCICNLTECKFTMAEKQVQNEQKFNILNSGQNVGFDTCFLIIATYIQYVIRHCKLTYILCIFQLNLFVELVYTTNFIQQTICNTKAYHLII